MTIPSTRLLALAVLLAGLSPAVRADDCPPRCPPCPPPCPPRCAPVAPMAPAMPGAGAPAAAAAAKASLYERLGGAKAIEAVTDEFLKVLTSDARIMSNPDVAKRAGAIDLGTLRRHVIDFISMAAGGNTVVAFRIAAAGTIDPEHDYSVRVWLDRDGDGQPGSGDMWSDQAYRVLTRGFGTEVTVILGKD